MAFAVCFGTSGARDTFVKIIYPGGHVEHHKRPVLASEIMSHNPGCWVTHPDVFHQPWSVVAPDTQLLPGQKFYVVPMSTVRKLRRHFLRSSTIPPPAPPSTMTSSVDPSPAAECEDSLMERSCLHRLRNPFHCLTHRDKSSKQEQAATELMVYGEGDSGRSRDLAKEAAKESSRRQMSPRKRQGNASPGTPTGYWQPSLGSITEE
ncbi:hypothetical protein C4D60_Mb07t20080 [Musa balbisiana]|uniref:Uncharacterized protein n=1 Tax=Musa balbisiana TaxID=52838 RepID=A0A4S8JIL2_MUSBA|nr:hypothetical protein C4D60_Mb07t20080 [Musa balbisiana]